jgi:hypothetical protein
VDDPFVVRIATFRARVDAELARAKLGSYGIASEITADDAGGVYPNLQDAGVRLLVSSDDAESATQILARIDPADEAPGNLEDAERAVAGRRRAGPRQNVLLLLALAALAGFLVSRGCTSAGAQRDRNGQAEMGEDRLPMDGGGPGGDRPAGPSGSA